ncbi:MAG: MBL fold metallo-hydrolase [Paludibacteraceae bacterium]
MEIKLFQFNPIQENTYVVYDETRQAIIIDCGSLADDEHQRLQQFVADNKLQVQRVLNTHLHLDHAFGNYMLAHTYGIAPEAHKDDEEFAQRIVELAAFFGIEGNVRSQALGGYLQHGDVIRVGSMTAHVLHTPGHSPGGLCFYFPDEKVVFTGDTLFRNSIGRTDLRGGDYETLIESIRTQLLTLPDDTVVYCGHGLPTTIGHERQNF